MKETKIPSKWLKSVAKESEEKHCSKCGKTDHNSRTCVIVTKTLEELAKKEKNGEIRGFKVGDLVSIPEDWKPGLQINSTIGLVVELHKIRYDGEWPNLDDAASVYFPDAKLFQVLKLSLGDLRPAEKVED